MDNVVKERSARIAGQAMSWPAQELKKHP